MAVSLRSPLTRPAVADTISRLLQRGPGPRIASAVSFRELPAHTEDVTIPTRHGDLDAVVYRPADAPGPLPVHLNFHGGGFVMGHPEQDDPLCRYLAALAGVVVVNVDYDLAPQHRFPVAVEEGYDVAAWAAQPDRPWDGTRLSVGGQSAGGAIAAGIARLALELGTPRVALQVLHYPPLDLVTPARDKRVTGRALISVPMANIFDTAYAPSPEDRRDRLASPAWGANGEGIEGIAPALVITCARDRLHDEGVRYARSLAAAGALREHVDLPGQDHGYNLLGSDREVVESSYALIAAHVRATTGGQGA